MPQGKYPRSEEHKAKITQSLMGNQRRRGIPHTLETRLHLQAVGRKQTIEERFWSKVEKTDSCWLWTGRPWTNGYGRFLVGSRVDDSRREVLAHRFVYELLVGPIPSGMSVCHHCDIKHCVCPEHLFLGTAKDNSADMAQKGKQPHPNHEGIWNGRAKLIPSQVKVIRQRYAEGGTSAAKLGREFGISETTILNIIHRRLWPHIK